MFHDRTYITGFCCRGFKKFAPCRSVIEKVAYQKVVPSGAPTSSSSFSAPPSILYLTPERDSGHLVINSTWDTALILDSASPLNPSDDMPRRSAAVFILLVECRKMRL